MKIINLHKLNEAVVETRGWGVGPTLQKLGKLLEDVCDDETGAKEVARLRAENVLLRDKIKELAS